MGGVTNLATNQVICAMLYLRKALLQLCSKSAINKFHYWKASYWDSYERHENYDNLYKRLQLPNYTKR